MSAYFVIGILIAVGAVVLSAIGLTREDFPPTPRVGRAVMGGALVVVIGGITALLVTTHVEHPREEAAEAAGEKAHEAKQPAGAPEGGGAAKTVRALEREFSIKLEGGDELTPGRYTFNVANQGKIEHDLAAEGQGLEKKTPLIPPGKEAALEVDLKPGKYKLYCTVPGHEQSGMKIDVTVR
jgi:plastocyanin